MASAARTAPRQQIREPRARLRRIAAVAVWLAAAVTGSAAAQVTEVAADGLMVPEAAFDEYVIGPGDILAVDVFELEELSKKVQVTNSGTITYPMLGIVEVAGLTKQQLEAKLRDLLAERYVRDPQVTVFLEEVRSGTVAVLGAVRNPGGIGMLVSHTVLDALSQAGGITDDAGRRAYVIHPGSDAKPSLVDLRRLMEEADLSQNLRVGAGDVIYVPRARRYKVFVYGQVESPGAFEVEEGDDVTVLQAVAMAGGMARRAKGSKVRVIRKQSGARRPERIKVNLGRILDGKAPDFALKEGDIVVVPKSFF